MTKTPTSRLWIAAALAVLLILLVMPAQAGPPAQSGIDPNSPYAPVAERLLADMEPIVSRAPQAATPCVGGMAGIYPCDGVDLMAYMPLSTIGGGTGNDIWGWTDPLTGQEYALMGRSSGTAFVEVTDPEHPVYVGNLPTHTVNSTWRDIKVYNDHAFIVSEASGHGMQVFDLARLRNVPVIPATFTETAHYNGFGNAHNVAINEDTGYAYAVGTNTCSGGLHMVNIQNPTSPVFAGCAGSSYTHDAQCVIYHGPDVAYQGREICVNSNASYLAVVDVTNKAAPVTLASPNYAGVQYTHQGWLSPDHRWFYLGDELDEQYNGHNTRTYIWDMADLNNPFVANTYTGVTPAIDHNMYIVGDRIYQSNYRAGLRILDRSDPLNLSEVAYFDIYPSSNSPNFSGTWSNYPYFASGTIVVSGMSEGLFVLRQPEACHWSDLNCDCATDAQDIALAASAWNCTPEQQCYDARVDRDLSGSISIGEVMQFSADWGWTCQP